MNTVKTGAELLIVSANETGQYHNAINPKNIVEYLKINPIQNHEISFELIP